MNKLPSRQLIKQLINTNRASLVNAPTTVQTRGWKRRYELKNSNPLTNFSEYKRDQRNRYENEFKFKLENYVYLTFWVGLFVALSKELINNTPMNPFSEVPSEFPSKDEEEKPSLPSAM